jgi:hypothetical protein
MLAGSFRNSRPRLVDAEISWEGVADSSEGGTRPNAFAIAATLFIGESSPGTTATNDIKPAQTIALTFDQEL